MIKQSEEKVLPSDSRYRSDLIAYIAGDDDAAQVNKEMLEQDQRDDAKLRGHK